VLAFLFLWQLVAIAGLLLMILWFSTLEVTFDNSHLEQSAARLRKLICDVSNNISLWKIIFFNPTETECK